MESIRKAAGENEGGVIEKPQESLTLVYVYVHVCIQMCSELRKV